MENQEIILNIDRLTKKYGGRRAVDSLSLQIHRGEIFGFIGHNGAGKTTTIKCCCGILRFEEGSVEIGGLSIRKEPIACKQKLAYIPDNRIFTIFSPESAISILSRIFTEFLRGNGRNGSADMPICLKSKKIWHSPFAPTLTA